MTFSLLSVAQLLTVNNIIYSLLYKTAPHVSLGTVFRTISQVC